MTTDNPNTFSLAKFPYPGLRPFKREESNIFFGRDDLINSLKEQLENSRFIAVVGQSGCGKSSLVRAGLLHELQLGTVSGKHWRVAKLRPGNTPFNNLAKAFFEEVNTDDLTLRTECLSYFKGHSEPQHIEERLQTIFREPDGLPNLLRQILPPNHAFLILVDQFEELFRYDQKKEEVKTFIAWLLASCQHENVYVIITMRSEFFGECDVVPELANKVMPQGFLVPCLSPEQLQEVIEKPAKVFGGEIEQNLVARLLEDAEKLPLQHRSDQLPLLQHVLMRMWQHFQEVTKEDEKIILTLEYYEKIRGLAVALSQHADDVYDNFAPRQQQITEILFCRLTGHDEKGNWIRHPVQVTEVAVLADTGRPAISEIAEKLSKDSRGFLIPLSASEPHVMLDISHESLIRQWDRLEKWAKEEVEQAEFYKRLESAALRWQEKGEIALWGSLDLEEALAWHEKTKRLYANNTQLREWAKRYYTSDSCFELAMKFLEASEAGQEKQQQRQMEEKQRETQRLLEKERQESKLKEQAREIQEVQRERTWAWRVAIVAGLSLVVVGILGYSVYLGQQSATQSLAELRKSQFQNAIMLVQGENYDATKRVLEEIGKSVSSTAYAPPRHARNLLAWFSKFEGDTSQRVYEGAGAILNAVATSREDRLVAAAGEKGTVILFDVKTGQVQQRLMGHTDNVRAVIFDPQGHWLASAGDDKQIILWSLPTGKKKTVWSAPAQVWALALSPDAKYLASSGPDRKITLWEVATGQPALTLEGHTDAVAGLAFSPSGELLGSASYDKTARLWQVKTGTLLKTLSGHTDRVQKVTFSPDGKWLATSSNDKTVRLWQVEFGDTVRVLVGHTNKVFGLSFIDQGHYLVSSSADRSLRFWDTETGVTLRVFQGHTASVIDLSSQVDQLFSASNDGTLRRWETKLPYQHFVTLPGEPTSTVIAPDGKSVAVGFADGTLRLYSLPDIQLLWEKPKVHGKDIQRLAFNLDGSLLASASLDKTVKVWQTKAGQPFKVSPTSKDLVVEHQNGVNAVVFSPDNKRLITASYDGKIALVTLATGETQLYEKVHGGEEMNSVEIDTTGTQLLTASDFEVRLWKLDDFKNGVVPKPLQTSPKIPDTLWATLSPDGQYYARVGRNFVIDIYTTQTGQPKYSLPGHENSVLRAIFSPDSQQLATVSSDATLRFWDLLMGTELFTLRLPSPSDPPTPLWDFDFRCSPNGCWIAVPLTRGKLVVYELGKIYD